MKTLSTITSLVHIGYDHNSQEDFEVRIGKYLEATADEASHIVNFVDESLYSQEDIQLMEQNYFAEALSSCLGVQSARSLSITDGLPEEIITSSLFWIPREVLNAIREILGEDWDAMAQKIVSFHNWRDERKPLDEYLSGKADMRELTLPEDIRIQISEQDAIGERIKSQEFDAILGQLQKRFGGRNIFGFQSANEARNDLVKNPERRGRIIQRVEELFGKNRMMFSSMRDGDSTKLLHAFLGEEWDREVVQHWIETQENFGVKFKVSDYLYGNADKRLQMQNRQITVDRFERFRQDSAQQIQELGFQIQSSTLQIVGGEYYGRCVDSWGEILGLYGAPAERIRIDPQISLVHADDV